MPGYVASIAHGPHRLLLAYGVANLADAMATPSFDLRTPNVPPIGLGWWLAPLGGTTAWWHGGGSPGGTSTLAVLPEDDLVVANFGNGALSTGAHDAMIKVVLEQYLGRRVEAKLEQQPPLAADRYTGSYAAQQSRQEITALPDGLRVASRTVPIDARHAKFMAGYSGADADPPPADFVLVNEALFATKALPFEAAAGLWGRMARMSFHAPGPDGRYAYTQSRFPASRRMG